MTRTPPSKLSKQDKHEPPENLAQLIALLQAQLAKPAFSKTFKGFEDAGANGLYATAWDISWIGACRSTNNKVQSALASRERTNQPILCVSDTQTCGQGQHGRSWHSPQGHLYLSLYLPISQTMQIQGRLSLEVALAILNSPSFTRIANQLEQNNLADTAIFLGVKWPNDLVACRRTHERTTWEKFGGILVTPIKAHDGQRGVIFGIGINCAPLTAEHKKNIGQAAIGLSELDVDSPDLPTLASEVVCACIHAFAAMQPKESVQDDPFADLPTRFTPVDVLANQDITISDNHPRNKSVSWQGRALGVAADGALKVLSQDRSLKLVYHGRVSLAPQTP